MATKIKVYSAIRGKKAKGMRLWEIGKGGKTKCPCRGKHQTIKGKIQRAKKGPPCNTNVRGK